MHHFARHLKSALLTGAALAVWVAAAAAQDASKEDKIIATVNGHEIRISEVQMATDDIIGQLPDLPPKLRFPFVVEYLIERHMLAQLAVKEGVADTDEYKRRLALYQAKALRDAYFFQKIRPAVTDEELKAAYEEESQKLASTERVRARHILVATEKEAESIAAKLKAGEKFEDLAKQYSLDGSKDFGGDLGYFTAPEMVAEFSKATFALKVGETTPPVKTDFGWHIIRLEDRKMGAAQPFDQVKPAIRNVLLRKKVQEVINDLRKTAKVEILDEDLKRMTAEADKQRKLMEERAKGQAVTPGAAPGQAEGEGDGGKGDLQLPQ
ncbi:MAG: peptidylprolyl isomerase [Rhizobiales bacterium]|nr:peptidylprolyl isomerase [Hyphomicrobiales bacterium]